MLVKKCKGCKESLPIDNFAKCNKHGNRRGLCKPCHTEQKQREKGTWEKYKKEQAYRQEIHLLQKEGKRRCRKCNEIKVLNDFPYSSSPNVFYNRKSYCKKCAYVMWRVQISKTKQHKKMRVVWNKKNQKKHRIKYNASAMKRYHNNLQIKLKVNLRNRLGSILRAKNVKKTNSALKLVGCDIEFLKKYLESKFKDGMTWDNWSKHGWHIDHIIPLDSFDLNNLEEQKKSMHYTNLQPLWSKENLKKGNKF